MSAELSDKIRLLIVDDDPVSRLALRAAFRKRFDVLEATNGREGVERFKSEAPDLVLMDVDMPEMDGVQATGEIRALAGERFVPIILLSSHSEEDYIVRGLREGADDYLTKPYNRTILNSKVSAFLRSRELTIRITEQRDELAVFHAQVNEEHMVAKRTFDKLIRRGCLSSRPFQCMLSSMAVFNGDVALAAPVGEDTIRWILADFTGHGLRGAIGTMPLATSFFRGCENELELSAAISDLNKELYRILPVDLFCAMAALELDRSGNLKVWNAGLPDIFFRRASGLEIIPSYSPPVGIMEHLSVELQTREVSPGDKIFLFTDGVVEAPNREEEIFGLERVKEALAGPALSEDLFGHLRTSLEMFKDGAEATDDVSIVETTFPESLDAFKQARTALNNDGGKSAIENASHDAAA